MLTLVAVVHIIVAVALIGLVLVQDSKGGGATGVLGGSGSNSLLGATGATTLFERLTRWLAVGFACSCILLTVLSSQKPKSVIEDLPSTPALETTPTEPLVEQPAATPAEPAAPATAPETKK